MAHSEKGLEQGERHALCALRHALRVFVARIAKIQIKTIYFDIQILYYQKF